jgi:nucleoid-associated protein YgaU
VPKKRKLIKTSARTSKPLLSKPEGFLSQIKWGESYTSLFLGAVVVLVAIVLVFSFFKSRNFQNGQTGSTSTTNEQGKLPESYVVKQGDNLWSISEKLYGSGYNWVDLASANKLENPGVLFVGVKLTVPNVSPKTLTVNNVKTQENPITGVSYTVVKGDYLWSIALRAYGDGYRWTEIAKANKLVNPNIIHPGNVLKLPR